MNGVVPVSIVVEGQSDVAVVERILAMVECSVGAVYGRKGKADVDRSLPGYNNAARFAPWIALRDLDADAPCAPQLARASLPHPSPWMRFRIAVREMESWLLADPEALSTYLKVSRALIPGQPETLPDPSRPWSTWPGDRASPQCEGTWFPSRECRQRWARATCIASWISRATTGGRKWPDRIAQASTGVSSEPQNSEHTSDGDAANGARLARKRDRELALQPFDSQPEHGRRLSLAALPLVDNGFAGRTHLAGELLLTEAKPEPQA